MTWCLLLLLLTAELTCWNPLWPVSLCILLHRCVQIRYLYTYVCDLDRTPWAYPTVLDKPSEALTVV